MNRFSVLIVDPIVTRRNEFVEALKHRFDVKTADTPENAVAVFTQNPPHAMIISLRQMSGHGLELAASLRTLKAGKDCFIIVHGKPEGSGAVKRDFIEKRWKVNIFLANPLEANTVPALLAPSFQAWQKTALQQVLTVNQPTTPKPAAATPPRRTAVFPPPTVTASRASGATSGEEGPEPSWKDLLTADLSSDVVKTILTKDLLARPAGKADGKDAPKADAPAPAVGAAPTSSPSTSSPSTSSPSTSPPSTSPPSPASATHAMEAAKEARPPEVTPSRESSWKDLLTADLSPSVFKAILTKDLVPRREAGTKGEQK